MEGDDEPEILLTNDDGIDAPGIRALHDALAAVASVTVIAPDRNQSAVGRSLSYGRTSAEAEEDDLTTSMADGMFTSPVPHAEHELGYAVRGTPCDCAIVGVNAVEPEPDLVVSGCNSGANLGAYVFSRSGTVSAAMEAAYLDTPSIAISMDTLGIERDLEPADFDRAGEIAAALATGVPGTGLFDRIDYLNVNVPRPGVEENGVELTRPTEIYEMDAALEDGGFQLTNRLWQQMANRDIPDPEDTDRHALLEGSVSVSPMRVPYEVVETSDVRRILERML
ncbi:5'/3'-nucleotidase SurE [Natronorubrum daqingense]|uniref:5'-nucleotidase SurE n=1 Tax=Natronorubrum daqingense TaxID=588898 RepID=A0A1N6Y5P3_9EURY|nr:5'/3'-nucleotidase SurE [Natronorubrum daqingense]APX95774.1 5'/3'-nucleotidase SurE [Natronorubrum daqingense]SIR09811.1 5'-nucleotidase /3'-nucleotidase /exopolyphosphatase [Natronorubrum daqingense]